MLVAKKENVNFNLPPEVSDEFSDLVSELGGKQKWAAVTAAILMLVESKPLMRYYVQRVVSAEVDRSFANLLEAAKSGELRKQAIGHLSADEQRRIQFLSRSGPPAPPRREKPLHADKSTK